MRRVFVAAGGGGDALAASIIHRTLGREGGPAVIATYAWDRLSVDPLPGPRSPADFRRLSPVGQHNYAITPVSEPRPPSGSTLPRLAEAIDDELVLLDPTNGATGIGAQLAELLDIQRPETLIIVDVGGDIVAQGTEAGVRSPLADGLVLAAVAGLETPTTVLVAGPGLDGELTEEQALSVTDGPPLLRLTATDVLPFRGVLEWHPTEATAVLVAAARGVRGRVEIRDSGLAVDVTDRSPGVYALTVRAALAANRLAPALTESQSLAQAEDITRKVCGFSEIDHERAKQKTLSAATDGPQPIRTSELDAAVRRFEAEAANRGAAYVTFRRIAEALSLPPSQASELRRQLVAARPERYVWPLWSCAS